MANSTRTQLSTDSLSLFPDNNSQLITPQDLRDWLTNGIESFVTQKDKSTFENAFYECRGSAITATSGTTNLALAGGNFVHITGSGPISITSFGTLPAGSRFILCFEIAVTLVYNATTMILPGAADIITAPGDSVLLISEGGGNWRLIGYFPSAGLPVGTVTAVTASTPLSSTGGNAPDISITQADATTDGYLSSADWSTFDGKQDALTLTTSGTSGAATLIGSTLNIPQYSGGGGGGTPGGADTEVQYNNAGAFGGIPELTYSGGFVQIETPKIGTGSGNGHLHIHSANSAPTGITNYLTTWWEKATRVLGFRAETDTHETYIQLTAPTADRTLTLPDASGNVLVDTVIPSLNNGTSEGEIRLKEATINGNYYVAIKAASSLSGDYTLTLPVTSPGSGETLISDTSGNLSWSSNPGTNNAKFISTVSPNAVTGTTAETLLQQLLIPANTYKVGDTLQITYIARRTLTNEVTTFKFYVSNLSNVFSGKPQMGNLQLGNSAGLNQFRAERFLTIFNATTSYYVNSLVSRYTDYNNDALSSANIDWTVDQYIIMTSTSPNVGQTTNNITIVVSPR